MTPSSQHFNECICGEKAGSSRPLCGASHSGALQSANLMLWSSIDVHAHHQGQLCHKRELEFVPDAVKTLHMLTNPEISPGGGPDGKAQV